MLRGYTESFACSPILVLFYLFFFVEHLKWWLQSVDMKNGRPLILLSIKYPPPTYIYCVNGPYKGFTGSRGKHT